MKRPISFRAVRTAALFAGLASLPLAACKDYLDVEPTAYYTTETLFATVSGASSAVTGVYDILSGDQTYGTRISMYFPYDTDEFIGSPGVFDGGRRSIARYRMLPSNSEITNPWNNLYQGVERANICIQQIPQMQKYSGGTAADTAALHRLHGEALTLRAQFYYELVRNWGDVPAPLLPTTTTEQFNVPATAANEILTKMIADLAVAEKLVPWRTGAGAPSERITKGAVKALRARLALARGGYSFSSRTGQASRPADYQEYYRIARLECMELMARREQHNLNPSFLEVFRSINELRREPSNEIMFEVGMAGQTAISDSKLGYYNGPRLNASSIYGSTQGAVVAVPTYFYAFDSVDTRRDVTFAPYTIASNNNQAGTALSSVYDGKFRRNWRVPSLSGTSNYLGYSWPMIRFADVLLMFAEADNEINGPTAAAQNALLEVRTRGFGGNRTLATRGLDLTSKASFFNALVNERYLEFGGEGIRKYDLIRWNLLETKLTETKANLDKLRLGLAPYTNVPQYQYFRVTNGQVVWARSFYRPSPATAPSGTTRVNWRQAIDTAYITNLNPGGSGMAADYAPNRGKELFPIPQSSIDTNRELRQNFGYGN